MKTKIESIGKPFDGKFKDNLVVTFDYLGNIQKAIITTKMLQYNNKDFVNIGDEIDVFKGFKNNQVRYIVKRIY